MCMPISENSYFSMKDNRVMPDWNNLILKKLRDKANKK